MNVQALSLKEQFKAKYSLSPVSEMEYHFEPVGETDQEKRKSSMAFVKRMGAITPALDEMFDVQHRLNNAFNDMPVIYKLGSNKIAFNALAAEYGKIEKALKEFRKVLKRHSNIPEVVEYYKEAESLLPASAYELMKQDFEAFLPVAEQRLASDMSRFPDFKHWDNAEIDWDTVNKRFKEAK